MGVGPHLPLGDIWKCFLFSDGFLLHCRPFNFQYGWMWLQLTAHSVCLCAPVSDSPSPHTQATLMGSALLAGGGWDLQQGEAGLSHSHVQSVADRTGDL